MSEKQFHKELSSMGKRWQCPKCGNPCNSGIELGKHYKEKPSHRPNGSSRKASNPAVASVRHDPVAPEWITINPEMARMAKELLRRVSALKKETGIEDDETLIAFIEGAINRPFNQC